jgi:hypothetical protein
VKKVWSTHVNQLSMATEGHAFDGYQELTMIPSCFVLFIRFSIGLIPKT